MTVAETVVPLRTAPRVDRPRAVSLRGVRARGSRTVTSALRGDLPTDARSRDEFLALTRRGG